VISVVACSVQGVWTAKLQTVIRGCFACSGP
jgi:hypothetical protein